MSVMASQITSLAIVYSIDYSGADQRKHQSSASLAFVRWIHRGPVNSPHKWPVTRKMFSFDDVIMIAMVPDFMASNKLCISSQDIGLVCMKYSGFSTRMVITLRPRQHGRHIADDTFKRIFLNENVIISIKISLKFVPKGPINNIPELFQMMAWRLPGDKPLSEAMMVSLLTHICVTRPQWVIHHITCYGKHQQRIAQDMISCMYWVFRGFEVRMALSSGPRVSYSTTQNTVLLTAYSKSILLKLLLTLILIWSLSPGNMRFRSRL